MDHPYLQWLARDTPTAWWHDSADPDELREGLDNGACGVTTNPVLAATTLAKTPGKWKALWAGFPASAAPAERAEYCLREVVRYAARLFEPVHRRTDGRMGYVCAQVNPSHAGDRAAMAAQAARFHTWAPNIAVKLPATAAGLDVLEDCIAGGLTITMTVSFTVAQILEIGRRHRLGAARARAAGRAPGRCFPVMMIGRLDDYLRESAQDQAAAATESDLRQAGLAVVKRALELSRKAGYDTTLIVAALRGPHHMAGLAGGALVMSIHPGIQAQLRTAGLERRSDRAAKPVPAPVLERLAALPEFRRAYEPDGLRPEEFIAYGVTQRTLSQFVCAGWTVLESARPPA